MVQYRAITKTFSDKQLIDIFNANANDIKKEVLTEMASQIATLSIETVDTGTYASSHRVGQRSGSFKSTVSSHGPGKKPRNIPGKERAASIGLGQMLADINGLPEDANNIVFRNEAEHAKYVESRGWTWKGGRGPHQIYSRVRNEFNSIVEDTMARLGMKSG